MSYEVRLKPSAQRALSKLPRDIQRRVAARIDALTKEPRPSGCEKLTGEESLYRVRVGEYRIVYQVTDRVLTVMIVAIGHRSDIYRRL